MKTALYTTTDPACQSAVLTLLITIAQRIDNAVESIFAELVPPLLALAGLPTVKVHAGDPIEPAHDLSISPDLKVVELARTALVFLGTRGPAGASLGYIRQCFVERPQYYRQLARYSLESDTLITPTVVPATAKNYRQYEQVFIRWLKLREKCKQHGIKEQDIASATTIQQQLLASAEEVNYPIVTYVMTLLARADADPDHWQTTWKDYLLAQLTMLTTHATNYRDIALLYLSLFEAEPDVNLLNNCILVQYQSNEVIQQRNAQYLLFSTSEDLRYLRYWRDLRYSRYSQY